MIGIILANTGSPASAAPDDIEAYLREYLMDERIRQLPKPLWKWLMHKHVLPKRKFTSAKRYEFIWTEGGSPLVVNLRDLASKIQRLFEQDPHASGGEDVVVRSGMSYGHPNLADVLGELRELGARKVVLLPLYPQSAYSPTLAVIDSFWRAQDAVGWHPESTVIDNYHDDAGYVAAMVDSIRGVGFDPAAGDRLLLSWHAIPLKDERAGDTYRAQIAKSVELFAEGLGIAADQITIGFQSVFGHDASKWTAPLSKDVLASWRNGNFRVVYGCPGFSIDCLETLYDIPNEMVPALEGAGALPKTEKAGADIQALCNTSGRFVWIPTLNTSDAHATLVKGILEKQVE